MSTFSITALCREFDVTARALRFYEAEGLLSPERRGQARLYSAKDRFRLSLIVRGKRLGFSLGEIADLIDLYDPRDGGAAQLDRSLAAVAMRMDQLQRQRAEIDLVLAELSEVRAAMRQRRDDLPAGPGRLPKADDYDKLLRARVDGDVSAHARTQ